MREIKTKELTYEDFHIYGTFANMLNPRAPKIGDEPIEFFRDMAQLNVGQDIVSFSVCRVTKRNNVVDVTEIHNKSGEGILPLDGDVFVHVGIATPNGEVPCDFIEAFRVPKGTLVVLNRGVWHHAPFATGDECVNVLIVLPERAYADDCLVVDVPQGERIRVVE